MASPEFAEASPESPLHGFQGNRRPAPAAAGPRGLAVAVSRESGARGGTIAARAGKRLGWQVYHQELLDYIAQEGSVREGVLAGLLPAEIEWIDRRLEQAGVLQAPPPVLEQARLILALAIPGNVILVGRGAGCLLPPASTLSVRVIAPLADRIAYMSQWLRMTRDEAAAQVQLRDARRAEFIQSHYHRQPGDPYQYDLLLNSSLLGEDLCVELLVQAARARQAVTLQAQGEAPPHWEGIVQ